jgi:DNA ligase-1
LLAEKWDMKSDPTGYWISEKLDGVRAHWNGKTFLSREGNEFFAPEWFTRALPPVKLDGELYCGRGCFQDTVSIVRTGLDFKGEGERWKKATYQVFDIVDLETPFEERISQLQRLFVTKTPWICVLDHEKCRSREHLEHTLESIVEKGGEGLMLREAKSLYIPSRSKTLYKVVMPLRFLIVLFWEI